MTPRMLLSDYLFQPLTETLPTRGGGFLNTIQEALNYVGDLPPHRALRPHWRDASSAILEKATVAEVTGKVKFALVLDDELDFARLDGPRWRLRDV
jgi:hypothetical protein